MSQDSQRQQKIRQVVSLVYLRVVHLSSGGPIHDLRGKTGGSIGHCLAEYQTTCVPMGVDGQFGRGGQKEEEKTLSPLSGFGQSQNTATLLSSTPTDRINKSECSCTSENCQ